MSQVSIVIEVTDEQARTIHRLADSLGVSVQLSDEAAEGFNEYKLFGTESAVQDLIAKTKKPIKLRRKYRFPDRAAAEDELQMVEQERHLYLRLARAQYTNTIQWVGKRGAYRVGLFDFNAHRTPKVVVVFSPSGQEPDLRTHDAYAWADKTPREFAQFQSDESQGLVELADLVSRSLRAGQLITNVFGS